MAAPSKAQFPFVELRLKNFRGFENALLKLDDLTILVGPNGVGKSTLLEGFEFLKEAVTDSLLVALERRGGLTSIRRRKPGKGNRNDVILSTVFSHAGARILYGFRLGASAGNAGYVIRDEVLQSDSPEWDWFRRSDGDFQSSRARVQPALNDESLLLPLVAQQSEIWNFIHYRLRNLGTFAFSTDHLKAEPPVGGGSSLNRNGSNLGDVLQQVWKKHPDDATWILEHLQAIVSDLGGLHPSSSAGRRLIRFDQYADDLRDKVNQFYSSSMSVGTLKSLAILASLRQPNLPSLVAIEDIEDSIHPGALGIVFDAVVASLDRSPVVMTTHSTELLSHPAATAERIRVVTRHQGASWIHCLAPELHHLPAYETVGGLLRTNGLVPAGQPETCQSWLDLLQ